MSSTLRTLLLSIMFLLLGQISSGQTDTLKIIAGQGIDNTTLKKSSRTTVKHFRKLKFTKDKGTGIACGTYGSRRFRRTEFKNDSIGLTFEFKTSLARWPFQVFHKIRLVRITITKTAKTSNNLVIGKSTRQDVINLYGLDPSQKNESYIAYEGKGIAYGFDSSGRISEIVVFQPAFILVNESW